MGSPLKYGQYDPLADDPVLVARRAANEAARRPSIDAAKRLYATEQINEGRNAIGNQLPNKIDSYDIDLNAPTQPPMIARAAKMAPPAAAAPPADESLISRAARMSPPAAVATTERDPITRDPLTYRGGGDGWGIDVSAAQLERDTAAREGLSGRYRAALERIRSEEALRDDPMDLMTKARRRLIEYEDTLPAGSESFVRGAFGKKGWGTLSGAEIGGTYDSAIGLPTIGEARHQRSLIDQALAKQNPKDLAEADLGAGRARIADELFLLRQNLKAEIDAADARVNASPEGSIERAKAVREREVKLAKARQQWDDAVRESQSMAEVLKSGFPRSDATTTGG